MTDINEIKIALEGASQSDKEAIAESLGFEMPGSDTARLVIWCVVLGILGIAFFASLWLTYERSIDNKSLAPFSEVAALTIGAIAGLLAQSPGKK